MQVRIAVVTGASQGIGRAVAARLARDGFRVWAVARRREPLLELAALAGTGDIIPAVCDLTDASALARLVEQIAAATERVDVLVHCAGSITHGEIADTPVSALRAQFTDNVEAPYALTRSLLPMMGRASTVFVVNSSQGLRAGAATSHYGASMHARKALADALRDEVNGRGIRVTSIYPGRTSTPRQQAIYERNGWTYRPELLLQPDDVAELVATVAALPMTAEVTDLSVRPAIKSY